MSAIYQINGNLEIEDESGEALADIKYLPLSDQFYLKTIPRCGLSQEELAGVLNVLRNANEDLIKNSVSVKEAETDSATNAAMTRKSGSGKND